MNKQESQQEAFRNIHDILKTIPNNNKNEYIVRIEEIIQNLVERSVIDISVPRIDPALLFDSPTIDDSNINVENEPGRKSEWGLDDCMTHYMEPKIANFYLAKHATEIIPDNEDGNISDYILRIINWYAPEMMQNNAIYTQGCEVFSYVMLLWELAFQKIPYEKMSKEEIVAHVTNGRRESSPDPRFYVLEFLNIQRKYLRIIVEGWDNKPEKRIRMDEILLRFSDIEADLNKLEKIDSGSVCSTPDGSIPHHRRHSILVPNLESVDNVYIPYNMKKSLEIDSGSDNETSDKPLNSIKTETIKEPNETLDLMETNDVNGTRQSRQSRPSSMLEIPDLRISFDDAKSRPSSMSFEDVIRSRPSTMSFDDVYETKPRQSNISIKSSDYISDEGEPSDICEKADNDPIPSETPSSQNLQNLQDVPSSISKELTHGLIINTEKKLLTAAPTCAFTSKPRMKVLDTIKFQAKLIHSSTFLLENHIESTKLDLNWISDADYLNNISQVDSVYLEIKYPKAEISFEKGSIKPSKEFTGAIQNALDHKNPYRELIKVFEKFGHFLPSKVILGDKLYSISKLPSVNIKSTDPKPINKEFETIDDFSPECTDYNNIIIQWENCIKSHNIDSSSLTSMDGNAVKRVMIKEWATSCIKRSYDSLNIIGWEGLYPLYEILNSYLCQEVKLCLGNDEQSISSGVKEKVLKSGVISIKSSQFKYRVNFDSSLESTNYQIFGKVLKQDDTQYEN
ncbi:1330_t:CDS:2, partial [Dentiscutata erythropus]